MSGILKGKLLFSDSLTTNNSFFNEIMTVLITSFTFITAIELVKTKSSPVLKYDSEQLSKIDFPFAGLGENKIYSFKMFDILNKVANKEEIVSIEYEAYEKTVENLLEVTNAVVFNNQDTFFFIRKVMAGCYLTYFDKIKDDIVQTYGSNNSDWPSELNFARIVRNAFAHNSLITIQNPNAAPVSWKHLTYAQQDNGKDIFTDFFVVELIDLMKEIDSKL